MWICPTYLPILSPGTRANLNYLDQLAKYHKQFGTNLNRFPSIDRRPLDLYKLKKAVESRGGLDAVCRSKKWAEIGRDLGYSGKIMSSLSSSLKNIYRRWLLPFEEYLRLAKPGVQQQLEEEHGGPFTPSPHQSPMTGKPSIKDQDPSSWPSPPVTAGMKDEATGNGAGGMKRAVSDDGSAGCSPSEKGNGDDSIGRRSKRLKKGVCQRSVSDSDGGHSGLTMQIADTISPLKVSDSQMSPHRPAPRRNLKVINRKNGDVSRSLLHTV